MIVFNLFANIYNLGLGLGLRLGLGVEGKDIWLSL